MNNVRNLINGALVDALGGERGESVNPATGRVLADFPDSGPEDVDRAVAAAAEAFPVWRDRPVRERSALLRRLADLIDDNTERLARLESEDQGKTLAQATEIEIPRAAANFRYFAGAIEAFSGEMHQMDGQAINYTLRRARGVAGCISPWNLPLYLLTWKIAPALATGNTVVAKPSEVTPVTAGVLGELVIEAGFPPGTLNLVHVAGATVGQRIVEHPDVPTITFTGSTETGKAISRIAGPMFKRISLELGGKNPVIVCEDADLDAAMDDIVRSAFANQGEICLCGSRILVHRTRLAEFMDRFLPRVRGLRVGDPASPESDLGAIVSRDHLEKIESYVQLAAQDGGKIACGGNRVDTLPEHCRDGFFFEPTVILGLPQACRTNQEEIFGPVVSVQGFDTHAEAVSKANDVPYGLACCIYTRDLSRLIGWRRIDAGIVWVNCWMVETCVPLRRLEGEWCRTRRRSRCCVSSPNPPTSASNWSEPCPH